MSNPPSYDGSIPTLHDDTHRGKWAHDIEISSMGNRPNLVGHLEHFDQSTTDGSFAICMANGSGVIIKQSFYNSIPEEHRPPLNANDKCDINFALLGSSSPSIGSTILPFLLTNKETGQRFRVKLYALVTANLLMPMFIGTSRETVPFLSTQEYGGGGVTFGFDFDGTKVKVQGI